jgi:hypothetical protein
MIYVVTAQFFDGDENSSARAMIFNRFTVGYTNTEKEAEKHVEALKLRFPAMDKWDGNKYPVFSIEEMDYADSDWCPPWMRSLPKTGNQ